MASSDNLAHNRIPAASRRHEFEQEPQLRSDGLYVQYGCAFTAPKEWLNFDSSPTVSIERFPFIGNLVSAKFSGNKIRFPTNVRYGNISVGLPLKANSASGVYASHVLEHLSLADMRKALKNSYSVLAPGGVFRLIVPDLEMRARAYVAALDRGDPDAALTFMQSTLLGHEIRPRGFFRFLKSMMGGSQHLWMWDYDSISRELAAIGFVGIRRAKFGDSGDSMFSLVEDQTRFRDEKTGAFECAVHCIKPGV